MILTLIPTLTLADTAEVVYLTVANTTFPASSGASWEGKILDNVEVEITDGMKVMDVITETLEENGISQQGADMGYITEVNGGNSILQFLGGFIAWLFRPLGFGTWQAAVATVLGLIAKEEIAGVFGSLTSMANAELALELAESMNSERLALIGQEIFGGNKLAGFSFMTFNLLCAPCFAACRL